MSPEQEKQLLETAALLRAAFASGMPLASSNAPASAKRSWSDYASVAALIMSSLSIVWTGGVMYGQLSENTRRISDLEQVDRAREPIVREIFSKVSRIEAQVDQLRQEKPR